MESLRMKVAQELVAEHNLRYPKDTGDDNSFVYPPDFQAKLEMKIDALTAEQHIEITRNLGNKAGELADRLSMELGSVADYDSVDVIFRLMAIQAVTMTIEEPLSEA